MLQQIDMNELTTNYLTNMPEDISKHGLCKTLAVRRDVIHLKHILTEIFVHKTVDIQKYLDKIGWTLFEYMEHVTQRLRRIHYFPRTYRANPDDIVKHSNNQFFNSYGIYEGMTRCVLLDYDGVITAKSFRPLYNLIMERCADVRVCSANPTIRKEYFDENGMAVPRAIYNNRGKIAKIKKLIHVLKNYDHVYFIDNEIEYLEYAWILGLKTYHWRDCKIREYSMCSH